MSVTDPLGQKGHELSRTVVRLRVIGGAYRAFRSQYPGGDWETSPERHRALQRARRTLSEFRSWLRRNLRDADEDLTPRLMKALYLEWSTIR